MAEVTVPGATLYYETQGTGPVVLCIPGGPTDATMFDDLASRLAGRYTVLRYDPRGHSRSHLDGQADDIPVARHADDAAALLAAVTNEPAFVYGSSSGATIGLELLTRHPEVVRRLVAHEPPILLLLPEADAFRQQVDDVVGTAGEHGVFAAMGMFAAMVEDGGPKYSEEMAHSADDAVAPPAMNQWIMGNFELFFPHEFRAICMYEADVDTLKQQASKLRSAAGATSGEQAACRAAHALAARVGIEVSTLPGAHGAWGADPQDFADALDALLREEA